MVRLAASYASLRRAPVARWLTRLLPAQAAVVALNEAVPESLVLVRAAGRAWRRAARGAGRTLALLLVLGALALDAPS